MSSRKKIGRKEWTATAAATTTLYCVLVYNGLPSITNPELHFGAATSGVKRPSEVELIFINLLDYEELGSPVGLSNKC